MLWFACCLVPGRGVQLPGLSCPVRAWEGRWFEQGLVVRVQFAPYMASAGAEGQQGGRRRERDTAGAICHLHRV